MAIIYGKNTAVDYAAGNLASFGKSYSRMGAAPLDMYEVWYNYDKLVEYASFRGNDANGNPVYDGNTEVVDTSAVTSYVGQKVAYVDEENNKIYHYSIELDGSLKEIGVAPLGDGKSITVTADGVVSLLGADAADSLTLPRMKEDKSGIEWVPVSAVVEGDGNDNTTYTFTALTKGEGDAAETYGFVVKTYFNGTEVEGGEFTFSFDVYTKSEVDAAIANAIEGILGEDVKEAYNTLKEIQDILEGTDGEAIDGLIEVAADNKAKLEVLNGNAETAGSVAKQIADAVAPLATSASVAETYATKQALTDHETAADNKYATKQELSNHETAATNTYATKEYVGTFTTGEDSYKDITSIVGYINKKAEETLAAAQGGSSETAASVKLQLDNYKTENDAKVQKNTNDISTLTSQLGTTNTNVSGLTERLGALEAEVGEVAESRIDALEGVTGQHTKDIGANTTAITKINTESIPALEQAIADEKAAREDADKATNDKIGTVENGKTVVEMINAVAGTIDFTPYATNARVDEIYKVEGDTKSGVLADALVDVAANKAAIELLNKDDKTEGSVKHTVATELAKIISDDDADIDTLNEIAAWIVNDTTGAAKMANDISALKTKVDTGDQKVSEYVAAQIAAIPGIPTATASALGLVSFDDQTIKMNDNKQLYVAEVSTDNLVLGTKTLVLNGGDAEVAQA